MVFFFHYNKPASKSRGQPIISLHYSKTCHLINNLICDVPTKGKIRTKQPQFVICGKAKSIVIEDGVATIK